jgi:hypothetical protein
VTGHDLTRNSCRCDAPNWRYGGRCDRPHDRCEDPYWLICLGCRTRVQQRCSRSSRTRCVPCSDTYRRRVRRVFASGWSDRPGERVAMLTVTAPGDREHYLRDGSPCRCTPAQGVCEAEFNATAGKRFNKLMTYLRRRYGPIEYARAAEVQRRGVLHFHVLLRLRSYDALSVDYRRLVPSAAGAGASRSSVRRRLRAQCAGRSLSRG